MSFVLKLTQLLASGFETNIVPSTLNRIQKNIKHYFRICFSTKCTSHGTHPLHFVGTFRVDYSECCKNMAENHAWAIINHTPAELGISSSVVASILSLYF